MASNVRSIFTLSRGVISNALWRNNVSNVTQSRCIFNDAVLKIRDYEITRQAVRAQYVAVEDTFRTRMSAICEKADSGVYLEDLKAMAHIVQKTEADLKLLECMIKKCSQVKHYRRKFDIGPLIMRAYYYLDEPQRAYDIYMATENETFNGYNASIILMALLYKHEMYAEVVNAWTKGEERINIDGPFGHSRRRTLVLAALAKMNTQESFEKAKEIWAGTLANNRMISVREFHCYTYILLQQSQAKDILSIIDNYPTKTKAYWYITARALLLLGEYEKAYDTLQSFLQQQQNGYVWPDLIDHINKIPDGEIKEKLCDTWATLQSTGHVYQGSYEHYIFSPITLREIGSKHRTNQNRDGQRMRRGLF